ncbi:MAG: CBS domain-containing protein [Desulfobulbaceae bacterium]|nr:CBS domain-containing protein [Desulfobulbaceae bacterium]
MDVITSHLNADFDAMASMIAVKKLYPDAILAFPGSQEKNVREFLVQSDYTYDFQRQKMISLDQVTRLIVVDTRQPARIGNFQKCLENPGLKIHLYDHHPDAKGDLKGEVEEVRPVGATATLLSEIFQERKLAVSPDEATLLAMAIYEDTGSFSFNTTTPNDLRAMAWLLEQGADISAACQYISQELTSDQVSLLHKLIKSSTTYHIQGIDIVIARLAVPEYIDEFALIVRRFMAMENLDVLFALASMGERIYVIARSRLPEVNVGKIAADLGGGGHASAASATVRDMTLIEAEERLIRLLHKHVQPESLAWELMSSPIISADPLISINEANQTLTRYSITVLPVLKNKNQVLGLISRRDASKAIFHGLGDLPVTEYMTTEFETLPSTATLADIQKLIIEHRQRFIPVVDNGILVGVITRTDLFNLLINDQSYLPELTEGQNQPSVERRRNLNNLMTQFLAREMIVLLRTIGKVAKENHVTAYAVGGFVRDLLLHVKNFDLDIVVEGDGIVFARKLAGYLKAKVRTHEKFCTAVVILPDGLKVDVATARLEYYEYPAAMPTVEFSSLKLDLFRRDFTINAMAINLNPGHFGILVDFFNCQNDLKDRQIRILHNLSFVEDPTRIYRAIRFEQRMGFQLGKHTERQIKTAVRMNLYDHSFGRRFYQEIRIILSEENSLGAIRRMNQFGLLKFLCPVLKLDPRLEEILEETHRVVAWYKLLYTKERFRQWIVYLLSLMARVPTKGLYDFCQKFGVPERYSHLLIRERVEAGRIVKTLERRKLLRPSEVYWLLQGMSHEGLLYLMAICRNKSGKQAVSLYVTKLRHVKTHLRGVDLKEMGYSPGPIYQTILNHLLEATLDGQLDSREKEMQLLEQKYPLSGDGGDLKR